MCKKLLSKYDNNTHNARFFSWGIASAFVGAFLILAFSVFLYFYRTTGRASQGGELGPSYCKVYVYGAVPKEGFYVAKYDSTRISELADLADADFFQQYYAYSGINPSKTIQKSETHVIQNQAYGFLFFPPANGISAFALDSVTHAQLMSMGLDAAAAQRVIDYRNAAGSDFSKADLLDCSVLSESQYELVYRNLYCIPNGFEQFFRKEQGGV